MKNKITQRVLLIFSWLKVYLVKCIGILNIVCEDIGYFCLKDIFPILNIIACTDFKTLSVKDYNKRNYS